MLTDATSGSISCHGGMAKLVNSHAIRGSILCYEFWGFYMPYKVVSPFEHFPSAATTK